MAQSRPPDFIPNQRKRITIIIAAAIAGERMAAAVALQHLQQ
jgi:hypothetical protein